MSRVHRDAQVLNLLHISWDMKKDMRGTVVCCYLIILLHIFGWVGVISRFLAPNHNDDHHIPLSGAHANPRPQQVNLISKQYKEATSKLKGHNQMKQEEIYRGMDKKLGSSPPNCENKCYGCMACEATQVSTDASQVGLQYTNYKPEGWIGLQYTNYKPEGWKCKCGPSFYSP